MAFVVEDGTGLDDANAYISVEFAGYYFEDRGITAWDVVETLQEQAIVKATDYIDLRFGLNFKGTRLVSDQALYFPRASLYDTEGNLIEGIPVGLKRATAEYALRALSGSLVSDPVTSDTGLSVKNKKEVVGPIEESTEYFQGGQSLFKAYPAADLLLKPYLTGNREVIRG